MPKFSNRSNVVQVETKQERQVNVLLAAGATLIRSQKLDAVDCKLLSIFSLCRSQLARHIEKLHDENQRNRRNLDWLNTQSENFKSKTDRNSDSLATRIHEIGKELELMGHWGCKITQANQDCLKVNLRMEN